MKKFIITLLINQFLANGVMGKERLFFSEGVFPSEGVNIAEVIVENSGSPESFSLDFYYEKHGALFTRKLKVVDILKTNPLTFVTEGDLNFQIFEKFLIVTNDENTIRYNFIFRRKL